MSKRYNSCTAIVLAGYWDDDGKVESQLPSITEAMRAFDNISIGHGTGEHNRKENNQWEILRMEAQRDQAASRRRSRMAREQV